MATATRTRKRSANKAARAARQLASLERAQTNVCPRNDAIVLDHFKARGVPLAEINPRENVLTFNAWKALGRSVRKGERGCPLMTWIPTEGKRGERSSESERPESQPASLGAGAPGPRRGGNLRPKRTTVFHISQTHPTGEKDGAEPLPLAPDDPRRDENAPEPIERAPEATPAPGRIEHEDPSPVVGRIPEPPKRAGEATPKPEPEPEPEPASVRFTPALFG